MKNILVISLAGVGDTLLATPLINSLHKAYHESFIDVLVMWKASYDLLIVNNRLRRVYQKNMLKDGILSSLRFLLGLRRQKYDLVILTFPHSKRRYRLVAWLVGAKEILCHKYVNWNLFDKLVVTYAVPCDSRLHVVEHNLALIDSIHHPVSTTVYSSIPEVVAHPFNQNVKPPKVVGIHMGSGNTKNLALRRWPYWEAFIERLSQLDPSVGFLLFGGPEERNEMFRVALRTNQRRVKIAMSNNFRVAGAYLRHCATFVSVDTSLMNLAASLRIPQVVIETPTFNVSVQPLHPNWTMVPCPLKSSSRTYYRYDGKGIQASNLEIRKMMESITVDRVVEEVEWMLKKSFSLDRLP